MQRETITSYLKKLRQLKYSLGANSATVNKFTTKYKKQCQILRSLRQNKNN